MYAKGDPRATLATSAPKPAPTSFKEAQYARFYETEPQEAGDRGRTWYARGQNLVVAYTDGKAGLELVREDQADEYVVLAPNAGTRVSITAGTLSETLDGPGLAFVPAGPSTVRLLGDGVVVRLVTTRNADIASRCSNAAAYAAPDPNVAPFEPWPAPVETRIHVYSLDVPDTPGRFGRIFRGSTVMVNAFQAVGPRDTTRMSPHHHDDFEQYSLCLEGSYIHYLRWPWTTDLANWLPEQAERCDAPSVAVITPPATHTSRSMAPQRNVLVDIFSPPRADFSAKPGWILNADDYPLPASPALPDRSKT